MERVQSLLRATVPVDQLFHRLEPDLHHPCHHEQALQQNDERAVEGRCLQVEGAPLRLAQPLLEQAPDLILYRYQ